MWELLIALAFNDIYPFSRHIRSQWKCLLSQSKLHWFLSLVTWSIIEVGVTEALWFCSLLRSSVIVDRPAYVQIEYLFKKVQIWRYIEVSIYNLPLCSLVCMFLLFYLFLSEEFCGMDLFFFFCYTQHIVYMGNDRQPFFGKPWSHSWCVKRWLVRLFPFSICIILAIN